MDAPPLPPPPDRDELLRLLGAAARSGSVAAIRALLGVYDRERAEAEARAAADDDPLGLDDDPFAEFDALARDRIAPRRSKIEELAARRRRDNGRTGSTTTNPPEEGDVHDAE